MISSVILDLMTHFTGGLARDELKAKLDRARPGIIAKMGVAGFQVPPNAPETVARDALFRLWRSVIPSGDIADLIRDKQASKVVPLAVSKLGSNPNLDAVVMATQDALLEVTF
jgi:hypothetical protein